MPENAKKPQIRFKGFTDDWEQRKLSSLVDEVTRNDSTSDAPIMMVTANNGFIEQSERYAFNNAGESLKKYILLKKGELAYNHGASKLRPYGSCFSLSSVENARIPFVYHCFSAKEQNSEFLSMQLNGKNIENQLRKIVSSGARMDGLLNISFEEYTSVIMLLPKIKEQNKIANFFLGLDNLITLHQRKLEKLKNIKKSMLEKMFPKNGSNIPEIRFKGFTDAWEQRKLGDLCSEIGDGLHSAPIYDEKGSYFFINGNNLVNGKIIIDENETKKVSQNIFNDNNKNLDNTTLLLSINGTIGNLAYYQGEQVMLGKSAAYLKCKFVDKTYLYGVLQTNLILKSFMASLTGTTIKNLGLEVIKNTYIFSPKVNEQVKIGKYFHNLDNLITLHQRKLEKLQNIKKACLEKMFV